MPHPKAVLFTDLDGTLLDHHDYSFDAALPALAALREAAIPLILTTSKTLPEAAELNRVLDNPHPVIVENGCALCFPQGVPRDYLVEAGEYSLGHDVVRLCPSYAAICDFIAEQRARHGWRLTAFHDLDPAGVAALTGLTPDAAKRARLRLCDEPFVWEDSAAALQRFRAAAVARGLTLTRGGRFWHLMGRSGKDHALNAMLSLLAGDGEGEPLVIALGDSDNDLEMLRAADIAVVVRRHDGSHLGCRGRQRTIVTDRPGPAGWNRAVLGILQGLQEGAA